MLRYGRTHCEVVILEGILDAEVYSELFEEALREYGDAIYAYYYDISFEETLRRHETKPNSHEFGEKDMRGWWKEKDFLGIIPETVLKEDISFEEAVNKIYDEVTMMVN